jgi:hypothetical protein
LTLPQQSHLVRVARSAQRTHVSRLAPVCSAPRNGSIAGPPLTQPQLTQLPRLCKLSRLPPVSPVRSLAGQAVRTSVPSASGGATVTASTIYPVARLLEAARLYPPTSDEIGKGAWRAVAPQFDSLTYALRALLDKRLGQVETVFTGASRHYMSLLFNESRSPFYQCVETLPFPDVGEDFVDFLCAAGASPAHRIWCDESAPKGRI